jgi:hypothetical protein
MHTSDLGNGFNSNMLHATPFSIVSNLLIANLEDNLHEKSIDQLETRLLTELKEQTGLRGVIFNCCNLITTDHDDLKRLSMLMDAVRLLGMEIGIYGVSPGLAVVIVASGVPFEKLKIGTDLDDILLILQK